MGLREASHAGRERDGKGGATIDGWQVINRFFSSANSNSSTTFSLHGSRDTILYSNDRREYPNDLKMCGRYEEKWSCEGKGRCETDQQSYGFQKKKQKWPVSQEDENTSLPETRLPVSPLGLCYLRPMNRQPDKFLASTVTRQGIGINHQYTGV